MDIENKEKFHINNYRFKKFKERFLVTTDHNSYVFLKKEDFLKLRGGLIAKDSILFKKLYEKGIILTKNNERRVVEDLRRKNSFLYKSTSLHIIVATLRCNMRCNYCHASSEPVDKKGYDMDKRTAKSVVDFIFQSPSETITIEFQGGEPLLNFGVIKYIIEYSNELNKRYNKFLRFAIVTNLTLMNEEILKYLIKNRVGICTSLDGPKKVHDKSRFYSKNSGSYEYAKFWIDKTLKNHGIKKIESLLTVTKGTLNCYREVIDEYVQRGFEMIHLRPLNNLGYAKNTWDKIGYTSEEFTRFWKKSLDYIIKINEKGKKIVERGSLFMLHKILKGLDPGYLDLRSPCGAVIGQMVYSYDGSIFCCDEGRMLDEDLFKVGDVMKDSFKKILSSEQSCSIISASINDCFFCDDCVYKPYCGLCPVCNYAEQGSIIAKIPQTQRCKILKKQFDYLFEKISSDKKAKKIFEGWIERN